MEIFLWESLKETSYVHVFKHFHFLLLIYRWYIFTLEWKRNTIIRFHPKINFETLHNRILFKVFKIQHRVFRHINLKKQKEGKITNNNILETKNRRNFLDPNLAHPNSLIKKELFRTSKLKIANKPRNSTKHC